jgi:uncharacterized protein
VHILNSKPLIAIIKCVSEYCNLRCRYCYYRTLDQSQAGKVMPLTVLRRTLKQIYSWSPGVASIAWHGGEPLLATLGFFEAARETHMRIPGQCEHGFQPKVNTLSRAR